MQTLSPKIVKTALALGGMVLVALVVVLVLLSRQGSDEPELLADSMAGQPTEVLEGTGAATVWVAGPESTDPRPGEQPDPSLCTATGQGAPTLTDPDSTKTMTLGETTLYPVAQVENYVAPLRVTCSGGSLQHVYVTR